jgi:hypothetical protein
VGHDHWSEDTLEADLEPGAKRARLKEAIFQKETRISRSLPVAGARPLPDDRAVPGEIEQVVGQVLGSLGIRARVLDRDHLLKIALRLNERAAWEKDQGRYELAEALCQRALDIFDKIVVPDHPQLVPVLENYAGILHCACRSRESALLEARAAAIRANRPEEKYRRPLSSNPDSRIQK